jgi:hypothetical protein
MFLAQWIKARFISIIALPIVKNVQYIARKRAKLLAYQKRGQRYTNCRLKMKTGKEKQSIKVGDKVTFDNDKIEIFKAETSSIEKPIQQYQQLVLAGIDQIGTVKELGDNLTTVSYPDGWELPVPTKYLTVLPE